MRLEGARTSSTAMDTVVRFCWNSIPRSIVTSCVVLALHTPQKLAVRDPRPATAGYRIDTVAVERSCEVDRQLLVK